MLRLGNINPLEQLRKRDIQSLGNLNQIAQRDVARARLYGRQVGTVHVDMLGEGGLVKAARLAEGFYSGAELGLDEARHADNSERFRLNRLISMILY